MKQRAHSETGQGHPLVRELSRRILCARSAGAQEKKIDRSDDFIDHS